MAFGRTQDERSFFMWLFFFLLSPSQRCPGHERISSSKSSSVSAGLSSHFLYQSGPFGFLNHTCNSSGSKKVNRTQCLLWNAIRSWFWPVCCSWYVWICLFFSFFFLILRFLCAVWQSVHAGREKGGLSVVLGWPGHHSRFHGLSGSNGLSGAEGFTENQRHIETEERRNRWADGRCRRQEKEIDSDSTDWLIHWLIDCRGKWCLLLFKSPGTTTERERKD